ncbi:hypothetical protein AMR72_03085 [Flavobacterium psychrophilum]|nr:hypothetical protein AMR72_03085 [Flavobacterium psychrophilum]AOE54293.1 hypothetical protein ALW18_03085 [Flavobacterium psychrophilum]
MKIKICGMKYADNVKDIALLSPDYLGFIFYAKSKRFAVDSLKPKSLDSIPENIQKVGVFVNETIPVIECLAKKYKLDVLQLHGSESAKECNDLKQKGYRLIKAFSVGEEFNFLSLTEYKDSADYFLFDTVTPDYGGSGNSFNWQVVSNYKLSTPFFLSGGLGLHNLEQLLEFKHPMLYGYDFNSRMEIDPGLKDVISVQSLIEKIKRYEHI